MKNLFFTHQLASIDRREQPDYATLLGIIGGFSLVLLAMVLGGSVLVFINWHGLVIVLGGTFAATLMSFSSEDLFKTISLLRLAVFSDTSPGHARVQRIIDWSKRVRREGELALREDAEIESDPFLRKCLELMMDGLHPEEVRKILDIELAFLGDRHRRGAQLFQTMGNIAPAMGLVGTLIGLVQMLHQLETPSAMGPAMSVALLTTLYGALLAHLVFYPLAGKLRMRSAEETLIKELTIEGVLCILRGTNPRLLETRLLSFLPPEERVSHYE